MRCRNLGRLGGLAVLALALAGCDIKAGEGGFDIDFASGRAEDTWSRTYTVAKGGRLELININGRIEAEPTDGTAVEVSARRIAKATSDQAAKDLLDRIEIREETGESRVRVEVRPPRQHGFSSHEFRWTVKVPRGLQVDLRTINGGVHVNRLDGPIQAKATNGGVFGKGIVSSHIEASTVNGGVQMELAAPLPSDGAVELDCVNGGVTLSIPGASKATIEARVVNGGLSTTGLDLELTGEQTRRRLSGTLNGGGARVSVETTNGGVRISKTAATSTS
jgi:hypothetical protein